jgi:hypothetical protein
MDYLAALNAVVVFGGVDGASNVLGDTRGLVQGQGWLAYLTLVAPPPRLNHTMARDTVRDRLVLFGGNNLSNLFNDTWELRANGSSVLWRSLAPANPPPARDIHAMAYDSARQKFVLFGGRGIGNSVLADTWEYDPQTNAWSNVTPRNEGPVGRWNAAMVYDPTRARCVLLGGGQGFSRLLGDVWEWDGTRWTARDSGILASNAVWNPAACFQTYDRRILLAGGQRDYAGTLVNSTLELFVDDDAAAFRRTHWPLHLESVPAGGGLTTSLLGRVEAPAGGVAFLGFGAPSGPYLPLSPPLMCEPSFLELQPLLNLGINVSAYSWFSLTFPPSPVLRELVLSVQAFAFDGPCLRATEARLLLPRP